VGFEVRNLEDYAPYGRVILCGLQPKEKALQRFATLEVFFTEQNQLIYRI
jgi:hypothetical protein